MSYEWDPRLEKGVGAMDETHREFVHLVDQLMKARDDDLLRQLQALVEHTQAHFAQENRWMEESGFPPIGIHMGEHARVLATMEQGLERTREGDFTVVRELIDQLPGWFAQHAMSMDEALARHMSDTDHPATRG